MPQASKIFLNKGKSLLIMGGILFSLTLWGLACKLWVENNINAEHEKMIAFLGSRGDTILWSLENTILYLNKFSDENLHNILVELARQPEVAWLAILTLNGQIVADSDPELAGEMLYLPAEISRLAPERNIQGRFSPDEPNVFETWKLFNPPQKKKKSFEEPVVLFAALSADNWLLHLKTFEKQIWLNCVLFNAGFFLFLILLFFVYKYLQSKIFFEDSQALARQLIRHFPEGILVFNTAGNIVYQNDKLPFDIGEGGAISSADPVQDGFCGWEDFKKAINASAIPQSRNCQFRQDDERLADIVVTGTKIFSGKGKQSGYLFTFRDISEILSLRKKLEAENRNIITGKMAAGIAHEIRNPLSALNGYAQMLAEKIPKHSSEKKLALLLVDEARRLNDILSEMLALTARPVLKIAPMKMRVLLEKVILLIDADARAKNISIELDAEDVPDVMADQDKILQALLNILLNAVQWAPPNGSVKLVLRVAENSGMKKGILVSVIDDGPGIPADILPHIFDPYFTTRAKGTGLGLTLSGRIMESHGGFIRVKSELSKGTEFILFLPLDNQCK